MERSRCNCRQSSSTSLRRNIFTSILMSMQCRLLMFLGIIFCVGLLFGMYFMWNVDLSLLSRKLQHNLREKKTLSLHLTSKNEIDKTISPELSTKKEEKTIRPGHSAKEKTEKTAGPDLSKKKDLSKHVKDYLPRHVFIDSSLGPPHSLELFMETYPDANKYTIYAFLADDSYKPLYAKFPKVNLYSGSVPSTSQNKTKKVFSTEGKHKANAMNHSIEVFTVNFASWLKDNVHRDEYVIVKLTTDPENEKEIVKQLVATRAAEWIDKFYTTTSNTDFVAFIKKRFGSARGKDVFMWDDNRHTYSDFDDVNPPKIQREEGVYITKCPLHNRTGFALLLYVSKVNMHALAGIDLLQKVATIQATTLPLSLFLPQEYLDSHCQRLPSLASKMGLGLYLQGSAFDATESEDDKAMYNHIRNKVVFAEHCFSSGNLTLDSIISSSAMLETESSDSSEFDELLRELINSRKYTTISNVHDVSSHSQKSIADFKKVIKKSGNGGFKAIDLSVPGGNKFVLHLLTVNTSSMYSIQFCADMQTQ